MGQIGPILSIAYGAYGENMIGVEKNFGRRMGYLCGLLGIVKCIKIFLFAFLEGELCHKT